MPSTRRHRETHASGRTGWLRAAVLGANDGIVSTASLLLGVAAADGTPAAMLTTGLAALAAGAGSMAVGEYVSVSSQRDAEQADIAKETAELAEVPERELDELTGIYISKGLDRSLARQVAEQLTAGDALAAHLSEELGITEQNQANPFQAAWTSASAFAGGAAIPIVAMALSPREARIMITLAVTLVALAMLGYVGAKLGRAAPARPMIRVLVGGTAAMAFTMVIGKLVGTAVA